MDKEKKVVAALRNLANRIEKGAPLEKYMKILDSTDGRIQVLIEMTLSEEDLDEKKVFAFFRASSF